MQQQATPRLIALEDARDWLTHAVREYAGSDTAAAVFATHAGLRHAEEALEQLIPDLVPGDEPVGNCEPWRQHS